MPETYPLEALLSVRNYREDAAKRALTRSQDAVREADAEVEKAREELEGWRKWRVEETDRRYAALIGRPTRIGRINEFNQGLASLAAEELDRIARVEAAKKRVEEALTKLDKAREAAKAARKNTAKIETHRSIWSEESKKAAEHAEDLELEEFKPMNQLGQGAEDDALR